MRKSESVNKATLQKINECRVYFVCECVLVIGNLEWLSIGTHSLFRLFFVFYLLSVVLKEFN